MKVVVYTKHVRPSLGGGISPQILAAVEGFRRHGIEPEVVRPGQARECDLSVCWGVKKRGEMASGRRSLVLERGYVGDRKAWTSVGYDGLNGRADFMNEDCGPSRWNNLFAQHMQPWRRKAGYALLVGQVPGDASIRGVDIAGWYASAARTLRARGFDVVFRPHPLDPRPLRQLQCAQVSDPMKRSLEKDLAGASRVVTWNSNTAVDAVLAGIPTIACDAGSMAWPIAGHDVLYDPPMPERGREIWARNIAYTQWSLEEITNGDAWDHLKSGMDVASSWSTEARRTIAA